MQASLLRELHRRRPAMHARWDALLHAEPATSPLALPDVLVHLIDATLDEVFANLASCDDFDDRCRIMPRSPAICPCGHNPYLAYFFSGERALREALEFAQTTACALDPNARDSSLAELISVLDCISRREIGTFCGVCQHRAPASETGVQPLAINSR